MQKRIDPLGILNNSGAVTASPSAPTAVTARVENTVVGHCPFCKTKMNRLRAGDHDTYVCFEHCVCVPVENQA